MSVSQTWSAPGTYDFVVPAGVTKLTIDVYGAAGGTPSYGGRVGAKGGRAKGDLVVTPGETLRVVVGGGFASFYDETWHGFNGGGAGGPGNAVQSYFGGAEGGGGSDVRRNGTGPAQRIIVGGGGGGGAGFSDGSRVAGAPFGGYGGANVGGTGGGTRAGAGGTQSAGGAVAPGAAGAPSAGVLGSGGHGGNNTAQDGGGGGGGGYYGGAGGGLDVNTGNNSSGGGGGSNFISGAFTNTLSAQGAGSDLADGVVTISYTKPPTPTTITPAAASTVVVVNPTVGGTMPANPDGVNQRLEWQIASDAGFTANLKTISQTSAANIASGAQSVASTPAQLYLSNAVWYIRARAIDANNHYGDYSAGQSFTVSVPAPPAPTAVTPAAASTVTTQTPVLGATITVDPGGRTVKGEWQIATDAAFTLNVRTVTEPDADLRASGATTEALPSALGLHVNGAYYIRAREIAQDGSASAYTAGQTFTLALPAPAAPTALTPVAGATVTTNNPQLGATVSAIADGRTQKVEWQLATDSGFTANVKVVTETDASLIASGATTYVIPAGISLTQTLWYMRARALDQYGNYGAYSASQTFTVAHKPNTNNWAPTGATTLQYGATTPFSWVFSDPSPADSPRAYQVIIERNDTNALVVDSGKVVSTASAVNIAIPVGQKDQPLRWKVRVWDQDDVASDYSSYQLFYVSDPPAITITSPSPDGAVIGTGRPTVTWTLDVQTIASTYRVQFVRVSDNVVVHDSGTISGNPLSYSPPYTVLANTVNYRLDITVTDNVGMSSTASRNFSTAYQAPAAVTYSVDGTHFSDLGYILIDWSATNPDAYFTGWRVYRRNINSPDWVLLAEYSSVNIRQYKDWLAPSGETYVYAVTQMADRSGLLFESVVNPTPVAVAAVSDNYWLVNPEDETVNFLLYNVSAEDYSSEIEQVSYIVVGRGRRTDYGTDLGKTGTLAARLRDRYNGPTAREQKVAIEKLQRSRASYYVRNPFGDLLLVSLGTVSVSRIAGVGTSEFCDITIPYVEVF